MRFWLLLLTFFVASEPQLLAAEAFRCDPAMDPAKLDAPQAEMNGCSFEMWKYFDAKLNDAFATAVETLGQGEVGRLKAMQRAWLRYRDETCTFMSGGGLKAHGSLVPMEYYLCMRDLTKKQFEFIQSDYEYRCGHSEGSRCQ